MPHASKQSPSAFLISYFSRRSLRLALQSTARTSCMQNGHLNKAKKKPNLLELRVQISSGFIQTKTLLSQPLPLAY
jgi:hypothetical protein